MNAQRILLMSSSRAGNQGYLEHAQTQLQRWMHNEQRSILLIPFAAVTTSFDQLENTVQKAMRSFGYTVTSIHHSDDPLQSLEQAEAIAIAGGNTFALLTRLYQHHLVEVIRYKVRSGTPYLGWSAGSNVACPTIRTTNDMPIIEPPTFKSLDLVPFQINPHFISGKPTGHNGESREERLAEFSALHPQEEILALPEGSALLVEGTQGTLLGNQPAKLFKGSGHVLSLATETPFPLSDICGLTYQAKA